MKKFINVFLLIGAIFFYSPVFAWDDCPKGMTNDPYPGSCSAYIDTDNNGFCDHSEHAPEDRNSESLTTQSVEDTEGEETEAVELPGKDLKTKTVKEVAEIYNVDLQEFVEALEKELGVNIDINDTFQLLHDNYGAEPSVVKGIASSLQDGASEELSEEESSEKPEKDYFVWQITLVIVLMYFLSFLASFKNKVFSYVLHKKIWNWILLASFLVSALFGFLLALRITNGVVVALPFNILFWHVEAGIALTLISLFHIFWHLKYFLSVVKKK